MTSELWTITEGKDSDWNVMLQHVYPDGRAERSQDGVMRARFRNGFGRIYFGSEDKKVFAITPEGTKKWEFVTGGRRNHPLSPLMGRFTSAALTTRFMQSDQGVDDLRSHKSHHDQTILKRRKVTEAIGNIPESLLQK